ncbi:MAG: PAS domain S-box protein [Gammaproteobacteria bacterium]
MLFMQHWGSFFSDNNHIDDEVDLMSTLAGSLIILGAIVMALNIIKFRAILEIVKEFALTEFQKSKRLFTSQQVLMTLFLIGYLIVFCAVVANVEFVGKLFVGIIFFLGSVFVLVGILLQSKMVTLVTDNSLKATTAGLKAMMASESLQKEREQLIEVNEKLQREITERKQAEKSLGLFRELIDQSSDAVFFIDPETDHFLDVNERACTRLGYEREELRNMKVVDIEAIVPDGFSWLRRVDEAKKQGNMILEGEHKRRNGTTFPVEMSVRNVTIEHKEYMVVVARDITERKQAEQALKESEEKYRGLFENSTDFAYLLDLKGNFVDVNHAAERLTGYTKADLIGMNYRDYTASDAHGEIFEAFNSVFETGKPVQDLPLVITVKDGTEKYFETSVGPLIKDRNTIGFHGISRAVTECKWPQKKLKEYSERPKEEVAESTQ